MATEPERLFNELIGELRPKGDRWRGCLTGDFNGNVDAPIDGWKYVRIPIAGTGDYALGMFPTGGAGGTEYNTPVLIEYDPINHQRIIAGADAQAIGSTIGGPTIPDPGGFTLPAHAWTHQKGGNDQLTISREQLDNLQISPSTTAGHVTVSGGVCVIDGVLVKVYLPIDVDLTAYYPASGVKYVWLTLTSAGAVSVIDPTVTDITALAWPTTNNHVLGFVMLKALLTTINWGAIKSVFDVIKGVTSHLPAATAQYQIITSGANPYPAAWSTFYVRGTAGGTTNLAVTNTKTLTLTSADDYNLTAERTGAIIVRTATPNIVGDIAGNARGTSAVDFQTTRTVATAVASGNYATLSGGYNNTASGTYSAIAGGRDNNASGTYAFAAGFTCSAQGTGSVALGNRARTDALAGVFMFGDSTAATFTGLAANEFALRARGGFRHAYDDSNYWTAKVSAAGAVTFDAVGASAGFTFSDAVTVPTPITIGTGAIATTAAGTLSLAITAAKTLTLTCADDFNLTIPKTGTAVTGTGTAGRVAAWVTDSNTIQAAALIAPAANVLTLTATAASTLAAAISAGKTLTLTTTDDYNLTVPESMTVAGRDVANTFTAAQSITTTDNTYDFKELSTLNTATSNAGSYSAGIWASTGLYTEIDLTHSTAGAVQHYGSNVVVRYRGTQSSTHASGRDVNGYRASVFVYNTGTVAVVDGFTLDMRNLGAGTVTALTGIHVPAMTNSGGGTITTTYGVKVDALGVGSTRYAFWGNNASAANVYNLYMAGTATNYMAGGLVMAAATGGDKGAGTINTAGDIYKNNSAYTNPDYALEMWATGRVEKFADNSGARDYRRMTLREIEDHIKRNLCLPRMTNEPTGIFERADMVLEKLEELYTHIIELHHRMESVEGVNR